MKNPKRGEIPKLIYKGIIAVAVFWILDFVMHSTGIGESSYYYLSKLGNAILFAIIWFFVFNKKEHWKKLLYSIIFGTWVSFYYLISSYSGLVQWFGIYARYAPPPFVILGVFLPPYLWWIFHILAFYIGIELANLIKR